MDSTWYSDYQVSATPANYGDYSSGVLCENQANFELTTMSHTVFYSFVFVLSLVGNSLVLWVLVKYESLESLTNTFILNLCLSDLLFSCLLPFWIVVQYSGWIFGEFFCKLFNMIFHISLYSSVIFLMVMTVHRYLSVVHPLSSLGSHPFRSRVRIISAIWVASIMASVPDTIFHTVLADVSPPVWSCEYSELKWFLLSVYEHNFVFLFSLGVILFCYVQILRTLFRSHSKRRHRTVRLIFTIVGFYFLSWAPYNVVLFLQTLLRLRLFQSCEVIKQVEYSVQICREIAFSHCCFNPVLYVFVGIKFRGHLKMLCRKFWPWKWNVSPSPRASGAFPYDDASFY
ncbi:chemokine XC receptor 1 isoform X2 [Vombatus ursinus]|uniref:X-C motif chemokine receptor 1 n=2 Tax=Vombatus ursinus TaxID=29139 RepID=A0A4X2LWU1_VOMUR|nr:chemokine XC receptor 1 isoform X2 [Vombatus ursinus]